MKNMIKKNLLYAFLPALLAISGCEPDPLVAQLPNEEGQPLTAEPSFVFPGEEAVISHRWQGNDMQFELRQGKGRHDEITASFVTDEEVLQTMTQKYSDSKGIALYDLLPGDKYVLPQSVKLPSDRESVSITVSIKGT